MDKKAQIKEALINAVGIKPNLPIPAKVISVDGETCKIELKSGLQLSDVRLKATITEAENTYLLVPKEGSSVIVYSQTGSLSGLFVLKVDEVEKLVYKQDGLEFIVDSTEKTVSIKNDHTSLLELFQDLTKLIRELTVSTSTGPSGTPLPGTITALDQLESKLEQLLK